jgi:hypothetical protein
MQRVRISAGSRVIRGVIAVAFACIATWAFAGGEWVWGLGCTLMAVAEGYPTLLGWDWIIRRSPGQGPPKKE